MKQLILLAAVILGLSSCQNQLKTELENLKEQTTMKTEIAERNKANTLAFFKALENESAEQVAELFSNDALHINPYHSGLFPEGANGKEGIKAYWEPVFPNFDGMTFDIQEIYTIDDANMVFVKYKGDIKLKSDAGMYSNDYYSTFKFNNEGKITEYVEIFNPIVAAMGFGLLDKIK